MKYLLISILALAPCNGFSAGPSGPAMGMSVSILSINKLDGQGLAAKVVSASGVYDGYTDSTGKFHSTPAPHAETQQQDSTLGIASVTGADSP